jgi:hypothetical protein
MHQRVARAVALVAVLTAPLLAGCGTGSAQSSGTAPPATTQAATPVADTAVPPTPSAAPSVDAAQQTKQVQTATKKFVRLVLTIGYPDKTFGAYTNRIRPLMTKEGFDSLESPDSIKKGSTALKSLYAQRARSAPTFSGDPKVVSLEGTQASAMLDYENVAQQRSGSGWKTLKSLGTGTVTVTLVLVDGKWLVENAS